MSAEAPAFTLPTEALVRLHRHRLLWRLQEAIVVRSDGKDGHAIRERNLHMGMMDMIFDQVLDGADNGSEPRIGA